MNSLVVRIPLVCHDAIHYYIPDIFDGHEDEEFGKAEQERVTVTAIVTSNAGGKLQGFHAEVGNFYYFL